jgi:hypothetical protein
VLVPPEGEQENDASTNSDDQPDHVNTLGRLALLRYLATDTLP